MQHTRQDLGWWWESEGYENQIGKIRDISEGLRAAKLPREIPIATAEKMFVETTKAVSTLVNNGLKLMDDLSSLFVHSQIYARIRSVQNDQQKWNRLVHTPLLAAKRRGDKMFPSEPIKGQMILLTSSIAATYEALATINAAKPWFLRGAGVATVIKALVGAGRAVQFVAAYTVDPLKDALDAVDSATEKMITILKWSSVAGGLYLLYKTLAPEKGK